MENRPPAPDDGHDPGVTVVVDTSVLLNLAKPVVDHENGVSGSTDPLKKVLSGYDIIAPQPVFAELSDQTQDKDGLLAAASQTVLRASNYIESIPPSDYPEPDDTTLGLDDGERAAISLANKREAPVAVDEFGKSNLALVTTALADANQWTSTPELLCRFGDCGYMNTDHVEEILAYYQHHCGWESVYVDAVKAKYL